MSFWARETEPNSAPEVASLPQAPSEPTDLRELFDFYHRYVKLLYSYTQTYNELPQEVSLEINAAFDHLSRHWIYKEPEQDVARKAYGHLKRSCLDIFKIKLRKTIEQYDRLLEKPDIHLIDNGTFETDMITAMNAIRDAGIQARMLEGQNKEESFCRWAAVLELCMQFEARFQNHPNLDWAKSEHARREWRSFFTGLITGFVSSLLAAGVVYVLSRLLGS